MLEDGAGIMGVHSRDRAHKPAPAPAAALTLAPFLPTCPGLPATRLGAGAHPQPAPKCPGLPPAQTCPGRSWGPFFFCPLSHAHSPFPASLLPSYPQLGPFSSYPDCCPYRLSPTGCPECPMPATGSGHQFHSP